MMKNMTGKEKLFWISCGIGLTLIFLQSSTDLIIK